MALWRCRASARSGRPKAGVAIRPTRRTAPRRSATIAPGPSSGSTQERLLKGELILTHRTGSLGEDLAQMLDGVPERIGLHTGGRLLAAAQETAQHVQPLPQAGQQVIHRLQGKRQGKGVRGSTDAGLGKQRRQQRPQPRGRKRVPWQHRRQEQGKRASAPAALAAVGAEDPLAADRLAGRVGRIVAVEQAVPIQRLGVTAAGTALLLERKSSC